MHEPHDRAASGVLQLLRAADRRRLVLHRLIVVSIAVAAASMADWMLRAFVGTPGRAAVGVAVAAIAGGFIYRSKGATLRALAVRAETLRPSARNLVVTAEELSRHPERASSRMVAVVNLQASDVVRGVMPAELAPARRTLVAAVVAGAAVLASVLLPDVPRVSRAVLSAARIAGGQSTDRQTPGLLISVRAPAYAGEATSTLTNPARIEALAGSQLVLTLTAGEEHRVRFGPATIGVLAAPGSKVEFTARENGYLVIESADRQRRELVVLAVVPDQAPSVRIEDPGRDLLLPDAARSVPVRILASDDLALESLELRYTTMSGAGEQFQFTEGRIPLRVQRETSKAWSASGELTLAALNLAPGDSVVYRATAADRRPGSTGGASDTYFVEIAGPGQVAFDAVDMRPDEDRYAFSQQMIVLKIERLRSRQDSLPREQTSESAAMIAAEQRTVRANFVFLLGGHVEDEEIEAEQSSEIAEGRLMNSARRDIAAAVREMTRAEQSLTGLQLDAALAAARSAVTALQRAFGKSRYLLRTLPAQSRIDPSRRLAGSLASASGWTRSGVEPLAGKSDQILGLFAGVLALSDAVEQRQIAARELEQLAERALAVAPASAAWQDVSQRLLQARANLRSAGDTRRSLEAVLERVMREANRELLPRIALGEAGGDVRRAWDARGVR